MSAIEAEKRVQIYEDAMLNFVARAEVETQTISFLSNAAAVLHQALLEAGIRVNWCGFYIVVGEVLNLGPFQGKAACWRISRGKGVCGTAWATKETQVVKDVHAFEGHIACDSQTNSEIVVPVFNGEGEVVAVIDVDALDLDSFQIPEKEFLEKAAKTLQSVSWSSVVQ